MLSEEVRKLVLKYALENALKYDGEAQEKAVMQRVMATHAELRKHAKEIIDVVEELIPQINEMTREEQRARLKELAPELLEEKEEEVEARELPELKNAQKGKVTTRYAPEPSGEMHIGHAFTAFFAHYYAKKYDGTFVLRFEDTNPEQEKIEYMDAHREALEWLGFEPDKEVIVSEDMPVFYQKAEELIKKNLAYTCTCSVDKMRELRRQEQACEHTKKSPKDTLNEWKRMVTGEYDEGEIVLRLRGDMQSQNAVMRDPAIFTIRKSEHCLQGTNYVVWPLYDFAVAVEDHLCGITHVGRSAEFDTRIELQNTIRKYLGLVPQPEIFHFARFNVIGSPASKRKIRPLISEGKVEGWDDIRLVTIKGLQRRGIIPETIKELAKELGMTTQPTNIDWSLVAATNRKIIDAKANRYFFVPNPVVLFVEDAPLERDCELPLHPDFPERGVRNVKTGNLFLISTEDYNQLSVDEEFRLKDLYNVRLTSKNVDLSKILLKQSEKQSSPINKGVASFISQFTTHAIAKYTGEELKPGPKIQWVLSSPIKTVKVKVRVPDALFIDGEFNEKSLKIVEGRGEEAIGSLAIGEIVQFERFGFVRVDAKNNDEIIVNLAHD
ncbi:MAG: glutamate--tRNA ligase [Candidatus Heimdallarchaeota archaeon]|nr:glutamate--tRNA ligase [Candidatus Heimdallarchaeota archaeon]